MISTQVVYHDKFDAKGFTNENSLASALLTKPDQLTPVLTHLQGREDKKFPLTFLTEGQKGGVRYLSKEINDVQYTWNTFNKLKQNVAVAGTPSGTTNLGLTSAYFDLDFDRQWLRRGHTVFTPSGIQLRVQTNPVKVGTRWRVTFAKLRNDNVPLPASDVAIGAQYSMMDGAAVSESLSMGTESNVVMPGKRKNQISFLRKSYKIAGNLTNKTVEVVFNVNGKKTNYWIDFERWQHMLNWKQLQEEECWYSEYNREVDGTISVVDEDTGLPVPKGAGVDDQIENYDTYGILTADKIKRTVSDVMYGATDTGNMNVVLFTGEGGAEEFDRAMKDEASGFSLVANSNVGDKFVNGKANSHNLVFGGYFTQYQHVDGHTITLKRLPLRDQGTKAMNSPKHPISGKPLESYKMTFLDMSQYDGEPNVKMVTQKGRSMIMGILKGMSKIPWDTTVDSSYLLSTEQDASSVHFLSAKGICIRRNTHCFTLECDLS